MKTKLRDEWYWHVLLLLAVFLMLWRMGVSLYAISERMYQVG